MDRKFFKILLLLMGILRVTYSENQDVLNHQLFNEKGEQKNLESVLNKNAEGISDEKNFNKRRTLLGGNHMRDEMSWDYPERLSEIQEFNSRKNNNFRVNEGEKKVEKHQEEYFWENDRNRSPLSLGINHSHEEAHSGHHSFRGHDRDREFDWEKSKGHFEESEAEVNKGEKVHLTNSYSDERNIDNYDTKALNWEKSKGYFEETEAQVNKGGNVHVSNSYSDARNLDNYDTRALSAANHQEMKRYQYKNQNQARGGWNSRYPSYSGISYNALQEHDCYHPNKGLVINFNTECPGSSRNENRMVHKFIFTPKPHLSTESNIPPIRDSGMISSKHMNSPYYYI